MATGLLGAVVGAVLLWSVIAFLVFLLIRAIVLWYFRINDAILAVMAIATELRGLNNNLMEVARHFDERLRYKGAGPTGSQPIPPPTNEGLGIPSSPPKTK